MKRFCLIIGAMKGGTTSLFNHLSKHPRINACKIKEPGFFSHQWEKGEKWYLNLWKNVNKDDILLEATANYSKKHLFPETAKRISDFAKANQYRFQFIYIMRDPIERMESPFKAQRLL